MKSEAGKAILGSTLLVSSNLIDKLLGLVSTLVLARILAPEDFGIIAIAMIVINFFELLVMTGTSQYLIQKETIDNDDINTCWTLDICLRVGIALSLLLIAPLAADFYEDQRLQMVISSLCFLVIIGPFANPGLHLHRREQRYNVIFIINLMRKGVSVPVTITLAFLLESYWAMVIGHLSSAFVYLISSYVLDKYRPGFTLCRVKQQWNFSKWLMAKGIIGYCRGQMDTFLVSKFFGMTQVGAYHVMKYVGTMPGSQVITPATQPLLASFSRKKSDKAAMLYQFNLAVIVLFLIAIPMSAYVYFFSEPLVGLLLGNKWVGYHQVFGILAILTCSLAIGNVSSHIILSFGKVKTLFYYDLLTLFVMGTALLLSRDFSISDFTLSRVSVDVVITIALFCYVVKRTLNSQIRYLAGTAVLLLTVAISGTYGIAHLMTFIDLGLFAEVFISALLMGLFWLLSVTALYYLYWHKTEEGRHIEFLIRSAVISLRKTVLPGAKSC